MSIIRIILSYCLYFLFNETLLLVVASSSDTQHSHHKRCGGTKHASLTRPCPMNDTMCGHWKGRHFHPLGCHYQDITSEQARKCLGNRTLAFIGDSQIRDISVGVAMFLLGQTLEEAPTYKFDYKSDMESNGTRIRRIDHWENNLPDESPTGNGYVFPKREVAMNFNYDWQVQYWGLYRNDYIHGGQVDDVLNNRISDTYDYVHKIDFAFWSHGLHDSGWWDQEPFGEKYFDTMIGIWRRTKDKVKVPSVWVSMNSECREKLTFKLSNMDIQHHMVEEANYYANRRMLELGLPYWDAAAALRVPERCNISDDGVHVKMWVDVSRAKMLFNHLCDSEMNWRGSINHFI